MKAEPGPPSTALPVLASVGLAAVALVGDALDVPGTTLVSPQAATPRHSTADAMASRRARVGMGAGSRPQPAPHRPPPRRPFSRPAHNNSTASRARTLPYRA